MNKHKEEKTKVKENQRVNVKFGNQQLVGIEREVDGNK